MSGRALDVIDRGVGKLHESLGVVFDGAEGVGIGEGLVALGGGVHGVGVFLVGWSCLNGLVCSTLEGLFTVAGW